MLYFSPTGLEELHQLTQQVKPFISESDYIHLSSITNSIREDGSINEADYSRLVTLVEDYTKEGNLHVPPRKLENTSTATSVPKQEDDEIAYISLLNFRYFLLSYSGVNPSPQTEHNLCQTLEH